MTMMAMMPPRRMLVWHHLPKWYLPVHAWVVGLAAVVEASLTTGDETARVSGATACVMKACTASRTQQAVGQAENGMRLQPVQVVL